MLWNCGSFEQWGHWLSSWEAQVINSTHCAKPEIDVGHERKEVRLSLSFATKLERHLHHSACESGTDK